MEGARHLYAVRDEPQVAVLLRQPTTSSAGLVKLRCPHAGPIAGEVTGSTRPDAAGRLWDLKLYCCWACTQTPGQALNDALELADLADYDFNAGVPL